jgi:hypothetical protein
MSFVLKQKRIIKRLLEGKCGDDPYRFTVHFYVLPESKSRPLLRELNEALQIATKAKSDPSIDLVNSRGERLEDLDLKIAELVLAGWDDDLLGEDGNPLPVTEENRQMLLDEQGLPTKIAAEWAEAYGESVKNSQSSQPSGANPASDQTQKD